MTLIDVLSSTEVLSAALLCGFLMLILPFLEPWLRRLFAVTDFGGWTWIKLFASFTRAIILISFVTLAYPAIFGLSIAPTIGGLIVGGQANIEPVVSIIFLICFCILISLDAHARPNLILPVQACLAAAYAFLALASYLGVTTATLWPGLDIFAGLILIVYFAHRLASLACGVGGVWPAKQLAPLTKPLAIVQTIGLLTQIPIVLLYSYGLGRQIAI